MLTKNPFFDLAGKIYRHIPLTIKMFLLTVVSGLTVWAILYQLQTHVLEKIFQEQLSKRLTEQALEDRVSFNRCVKRYSSAAKLIAAQKDFSNYIERQKWSSEDTVKVKYHKQHPSWLPSHTGLQIFPKIRYAFLLDSQGRVREIFYYITGAAVSLPSSLLNLTPVMLQRSLGRSFLTDLDGSPYLIAAEPYINSRGKSQAILILFSPVDDEFLIDSLGASYIPGHVVALVTPGENPQIITSSNLMDMPAGMPVKELEGNYVIAGEEFFDYGGTSDIYIKFLSFMSNQEIKSVIELIISEQQRQQTISAFIFILTAVLMMLWVTRRVQTLTQHVINFSRDISGVKQADLNEEKGDQIYLLESRFKKLTEDVINARATVKKESEEILLLQKRQMEMVSEEKQKQLDLLHTATEAVGVGLIINTPEGLELANEQMKKFADMCGGLSVFDIKDARSVERTILANDGSMRIFYITRPEIFRDEKTFLVQDITETRKHTESLEYMALHDALTGLPNRKLFQDLLQHIIFSSQRSQQQFAILIMDLNHFKEINDTLGHHIGDLVLKEIGQRLPLVLRKSDTIARWGGDEFAVLLPATSAEGAQLIARKLLKAVEQPFVIEGNSLYIEASAGISFFPQHGEDVIALLQKADAAMYASKLEQSGVSIYIPGEFQPSIARLTLMGELRHAIEHEELLLQYQPKINYKTGHVIGVEALVRWQHPQQGLMPPGKFIPLAEHTGLIKPMTHWVLNKAISQCMEWRRTGIEIDIAINLSTRSLLDFQLRQDIADLLKEWSVIPGKLVLEITESAMMADPQQAMKILTGLAAMGVRLAIDDFGIGSSSLAYLKKLHFDEIKIDKSFIMDMAVVESNALIVSSIIDLARNLGIRVVGEGVENEDTYNMLELLGCDGAQGYYISPPLFAGELMRWLSISKWTVIEKE